MHRNLSVADKMTAKTERNKVTKEGGDKWKEMEGREEEPLHEAVKMKPGLHLETSGS